MSKNERPLGPSGKSILHFILCNSRKEAEERAREAGKGNPPLHDTTHKIGQYPHFHPADRYGNKIENGTHFQYPQDNKFFSK